MTKNGSMDARRGLAGALLLVALLAIGCGGNAAQARLGSLPAATPGGPASAETRLPNGPGRLAAARPDGLPVPGVPLAPSLARPMPAGVQLRDVAIAGDPTRLVLPPGHGDGQRRPALLFMHGHGMDQTQLTERTGLAEAAAHEGWIAASGDLGGRAHWGNDAALRGVGALVQQLVAGYAADPQRIYLVGFSMGGGTALLAAANPLGLPYQVAAVVSTQGFTDLQAMTTAAANGGGFTRSIADAYGGEPTAADFAAHSPQALVAKLAGLPVYLEHGEADKVVPASHSQKLAAKLPGATLHLYPGLGHGEQTIDEVAIIGFLRGKTR